MKTSNFRKNLFLFPALLLTCISCSKPDSIREAILTDKDNFYYIDFKDYPSDYSSLPIGIFDSGTGGLSTLDDIIDHEGLKNESFTFLGDLANMPYGSYALENNTPLLVEHILKDVQFLLGNKYYQSNVSRNYLQDKSPVKAIVIACNTATAYGLDTIRKFISDAGLDIGVIGVIDAGAQGAFGNFSPDESGCIAVLATDGTVRSGAYPATITYVKNRDGLAGTIPVFQQAGIGIAEAIDEKSEFIDRTTKGPRQGYMGPSEKGTGEMKIDTALWARYDFDIKNGAMLFEGDPANPYNLQINSVENYISFHLVTLLEKIRNTAGVQPLNSVVLACTHYPFFTDTFRAKLAWMRDYSEKGEFIYRPFISEDLIIVNPATVVAGQLYQHLLQKDLLNRSEKTASEFYVTIPNTRNKNVILRDDGSFTYEYKYGRQAGEIQEYVRCVPFSRSVLPEDMLLRLEDQVPGVYDLIVQFNHENNKTQYLKEEERIKRE
ncbi:MAG: hypothetical protein MUC78_10720 [Bacteroidales bacterium]|jgi:glutamate racemase|nr:hypothetical protein [Bacteroidales bacterium]